MIRQHGKAGGVDSVDHGLGEALFAVQEGSFDSLRASKKRLCEIFVLGWIDSYESLDFFFLIYRLRESRAVTTIPFLLN